MSGRNAAGVLLSALVLFATACGGGSSPGAPTPAPTPTPTPTPAATPPPPCPDGACGNTSPVVRTQLRLYLLFDDKGKLVEPTPDPVKQVVEEPIPVGYRIRLDVTGRDAEGRETNGKGQITWFYSDDDMVGTDPRSAWQRDVTVLKPGKWSVYVIFDGVGSNDLNFTFVAKK